MIRALVAALALALTLVGCSDDAASERPDTLPDLTLQGFDGDPAVDLGEVRGPMVINLWASWCGACVEELPLIEEFHQQYGDQLAVLGIDFQDSQPVKAAEMIATAGVTYDLVTDPEGSINGQGAVPSLRGLPFWALVDQQGTVTHVNAAAVDSVADIVAMVNDHLGLGL